MNYRGTMAASYLGYITQAIVVNLPPLLFVTFQSEYHLSLSQIGFLVTVCFVVQIVVDLLATRMGERLRYRPGAVVANGLAAAGIALMAVLPDLLPDSYVGLMIATVLMAIGGGLIEVLVSPIVDAIAKDSSPVALNLLHSFYCWGFVLTVLLSALFFSLFSTAAWRTLVWLWVSIPLLTAILFAAVPLPAQPTAESADISPLRFLLSKKLIWLLMLLMVCSGAAEQAVGQWASLFAESGLRVSKTLGDLLGPCLFAALAGCARVFFAGYNQRHDVRRSLAICGVGCTVGYLLIVLAPWPLLSLAGFGVTGFCVGIMWPGVLGLASSRFPTGGTTMFALLALCGDLGCSAGPAMVGAVSDRLQADGMTILPALQHGIALAIVFPLLIAITMLFFPKKQK